MLTKSAKGPHLNLHATQFNSKESLSQQFLENSNSRIQCSSRFGNLV